MLRRERGGELSPRKNRELVRKLWICLASRDFVLKRTQPLIDDRQKLLALFKRCLELGLGRLVAHEEESSLSPRATIHRADSVS